MGILDRILNRSHDDVADPYEDIAPRECLHVSLLTHWDDPNDMGMEAKASRFDCASCGESFTPAEAEMLRATEAERIRGGVGPGAS